jgi:AcrR family transcriptional regulator
MTTEQPRASRDRDDDVEHRIDLNVVDDQPGPRRPGRPRSTEARERILRAAWNLVASRGYAGLTMEAVAVEARAGLNTIYKRWTSKHELVADAIALSLHEGFPIPDTGSMRSDIAVLLSDFDTYRQASGFDRVLVVIMAEALRDSRWEEHLAKAHQSRRTRARPMVERAITRGELRPDTDVDLLMDLLNGVMLERLVVSRSAIPADQIERLVEVVLAAFSTQEQPGPS